MTEKPINVFVQGPEGEDYFTADDILDCWISNKYGALAKRLAVQRTDGKTDIFAIAVDGLAEYKNYTASFEYAVLRVFNPDGTLHTAYAPGQWALVDGNKLAR